MRSDLKWQSPVAIAVARARQHEGYLRCEHLLRAFDRALRLLAAATCGRYLEHLRSGGERIVEADAVVAALVRPSLGQWVAIVRDATEALGTRGLVTAAFRAFVQKESPRLARIVALRNDREHAEDESRDEEIEGLITSFLEAAAALPEMSLTASDAGGRVRIASAEIDLSPLVVGTPEGDDGVEVFLYHGRHRKKGTLVHMAASRGGTETIDDDQQLARSFDLLVQPGAEASRAIATRVTESPFRKLRAYSYRDADVFRGREQSVRDVADLIDEKALVVLHAPSGTGKTSLLRAGVRPALDDAFTWIEVEARGDVVALAADAVGHELALRGRPATGELAERIRVLAELTGRSVLLVVDALEELFRGSETDIDRRVQDFATAIASVLAAPERCHVLLSIRADFFGQLERLREAGLEKIFADTIALRPLDSAGARTALIEPLAAAGLTLGGKLAETIVRDLGGETQAVSVVELAIVGDALFERAKTAAPERPATIEPAVYASLGGAGEVLAAYVRGALAAFAPEERGDVQKLLTSMLGAAGVRLPPAGLAQIVERSRIDVARAERLLGALVDARVVQTASAGAAPTFRISHDLVALELFGQLGEAERRALEVRESLETAARAWHVAGRPRSGFPAAKQLAYYEQASGVSRVAEEFLVGARRAATRRRRLERGALAVMAMLTIAASIAAVLAWRSTRARRVSLRDALASEAMALAQVPHRQKDAVVSALRAIALDGRPLGELDGRLTSALSRAASAAGAGARFVDLEEQSAAPSVGRFSPDGATVAIGDRSGEVALFDARTGRRTRVLGKLSGDTRALAFSRDGAMLASTGDDHAIGLWSVATGRHLTLRGHYRDVGGLAFAPDGKHLASASEDGTARVWDVASGRELRVIRGHGVTVYAVDVSPDGGRIAVATMDGLARVIERSSGRTLVELHPAHPEGYLDVEFARDGRITTASVDGTARIWDGASGKLLATLSGHRSMVRTAVVSPLGDRIATASVDGTLVLWNGRTYEREREPIVHDGPLTQAAFSPDGRKLATASYGGLVRILDATTGRELQRLSHATDVWSVDFTPTGTHLLTTTFGATYLWSLASGRVQASLVRSDKGKAINTSISSDGKWIAVGETWGVRLWNARTLQAVRYWPHGGNASVAFTPDGRKLITGSTNKLEPAVRVFDVQSGTQELEINPGGGAVFDVAYDARGQLVTVGRDNAVRVWDPSTGAARAVRRPDEEATLGVAPILDLAASRARPIAVVTTDRIVRAWDLEAAKPLWTTELLGHVAHDVGLSPDGKLAIVGSRDETARILDVATGELRGELVAPSVVRSVDLAADGRALVVSAANVRIWLPDRAPLWTASRVASLETPGIERVVLSPDGMRIASVSAVGRLALHERTTGRRLWWTAADSAARDVAIAGDGARLVAALGSDVALVDASDGRIVARATGHPDNIDRVAVSRDGKRALSADYDSVVSWAIDGDRLEQVGVDTSHSGIVSIAFSPDGQRVVLGLVSGEIAIVDASTWTAVGSRAGHRSDVRWVEVCDDGKRIVSAGFDRTARIWDATSDAPPLVLRGHTGSVNEAHFIDGCTRIVTASEDQTIAIWDAATGERQLVHARLDAPSATSVAVTRDARDFVYADGRSLVMTGPFTLETYLEAACAALEEDARLGEFRALCEAPLASLARRPPSWSRP